MLQYLSGVGFGKPKKAEKKAISVTKKQAKKSKLTPVTKSRINKLQVQTKIRKAFVKKDEPIKVTEEEIVEETNQPTEEIAEETPSEETQAQETEESEADLGIYYPEFGKVKLKMPKLKGKLKGAVKKSIQRLKDDKHKPVEKVAHLLAKEALLIPRGAFLAIILLGKALEKTPIKINIGKKISDAYKTKKKEIDDFWYKVGGEPDILETQIKKFKSSKINGSLGVVVEAGASVATASPLIMKFLKIFNQAKEYADKHPQLVATGQAIIKKGLEDVVKKNPEQAKNINLVADQITKVLPPETQTKINDIRKNLPKNLPDKIIKNTTTEIKNINTQAGTTTTETTTTKSNTMLYAIGGAVLIGGYLLMKKKK